MFIALFGLITVVKSQTGFIYILDLIQDKIIMFSFLALQESLPTRRGPDVHRADPAL